MKLILGFVGEISSGKGTACNYVIEKHHAGYHRFSTILRDVLDRLFVEQSRANLQNVSTALRQVFGDDLMAKVMASEVDADPAQLVCVDGIRRPADIIELKKMEHFHIIHITADAKMRYERLTGRQENSDDQKKTYEQFLQDQLAESERMITQVSESSDFKIDNSGTKEDLYRQLDAIITKLSYGN